MTAIQLCQEPSMMRRKSLISAVFLPLVGGLVGLMTVMNRPRFASFHNVDALELVASGLCFGVALAALIALLRAPRAS